MVPDPHFCGCLRTIVTETGIDSAVMTPAKAKSKKKVRGCGIERLKGIEGLAICVSVDARNMYPDIGGANLTQRQQRGKSSGARRWAARSMKGSRERAELGKMPPTKTWPGGIAVGPA